MKPKPDSATSGDMEQFTAFMRKLVSVPHEEIKARIEAEKDRKQKIKVSASRDSGEV